MRKVNHSPPSFYTGISTALNVGIFSAIMGTTPGRFN